MDHRTYTTEWLVDRLVEAGLIVDDTAQDILVRAPQQRARFLHLKFDGDRRAISRYKLDPGEVVAFLAVHDTDGRQIDEHVIAGVLADAAGLPHQRIDPLAIDTEFAARALPRAFANRHAVLPLRQTDDALIVAVADPFDDEVVASLGQLGSGLVERVVASKGDILKYLAEIFGFRMSIDSAAKEADGDPLADFEQLVRLRTAGEIEYNDKHVVNAVDLLLSHAFDQRASDIHIEPRRKDSQVRLRIDGVLHRVHTFPRRVHLPIVCRIKSMARLDIAEKRRPQDGRIKTLRHDKSVELRVSTMPVAFGEKVVMRIFDPGVLMVSLANLGFDPAELEVFDGWIRQPHGLVLVTGPTGSGKSTTLYAALRSLAGEVNNIVTVEDPIEMVQEHFNQVQVQPKIGVDFASALKTILRQDPDVIMVGEIRDAATAEMATQAALTGHMVLSTLHTNDSVGAVTRLRDQGLPNYLIASTLRGVMAQRLVRRLCVECKRPQVPSDDEFRALGVMPADRDPFGGAAVGVGCHHCRGTGYRGRVGLFEMLTLAGEVAGLVRAGESDEEIIRGAGLRAGMTTLRRAGLRRVADGSTSVEEVLRIAGVADSTAADPLAPMPAVRSRTPGERSTARVAVPSPAPGATATEAAALERAAAPTEPPIEITASLGRLVMAPPATVDELIERYAAGERSFSAAVLPGVDLFGADLHGADLTDANLSGAYVTDVNLSGATLIRADLKGADLRWSDLSGADLCGADLTGCKLSGANLAECRSDAATRWPAVSPRPDGEQSTTPTTQQIRRM